VAAAPDSDPQARAAREADRRDHIRGARAADDEGRPVCVVRAVPDPARLGVAVIGRGQDFSPNGVPQLLNCCFPEHRGDRVAHVRLPFVVEERQF